MLLTRKTVQPKLSQSYCSPDSVIHACITAEDEIERTFLPGDHSAQILGPEAVGKAASMKTESLLRESA
jgi:hypothetical protein